MTFTPSKVIFAVCAILMAACRPAGSGESGTASISGPTTVVGVKSLQGGPILLSQISSRSMFNGIKCNVQTDSSAQILELIPTTRARILSVSGQEYFVQLRNPIDAAKCTGQDANGKFDYKTFFIKVSDVELVYAGGVTPAPVAQIPFSIDDIKSSRAEALARDMERRRSGGGKSCGLTSFGSRGCWACVGWAMTDTGIFPKGLGADADATPNGFLRATQAARSRKGADGVVNINGKRFRSLLPEFRATPSLAPRGSILFCNTSAAGHAAVITIPANEMRSDVIEILSAQHRQSLCWDQVQEILFPLD